MSEHEIYARWLDRGTRIGLILLAASFLAYALALFDPLIAPRELARLWALPVDQYIAASGAPTGWGWLRQLHKSDCLIFVAVAMLALVTLACYVRVVPLLFLRGERLRAALALAQIVVLVAAALL